MTIRRHSTCSLIVAAALLAAGHLYAQGTASLRGTVSDQLNAVIPAAKITLTDKDTGAVRAALTQDGGQYQFLQLRPGSYMLRAEAPGLSPQQVDGIRLLVDTPATIDVMLQVASASAEVNVTAEAAQLNTVDATVGIAFEHSQVSSLPIQTRNAAQLLSLQPGVTQNGEVMGARRDQNNITLDGVDANDNQNALSGLNGNNQGGLPAPSSNPTATTSIPTTGFNAALPVPLDSVQEFRVTVAGNGAADGRSSGGQVSLVTRSGTNALHGSAYEYNRNTAYTANNWFNNRSGLARPQLIRNQFGASLGGPVKKDHLFYFANYERRIDNSQQTQTRTVPSEGLKQGIVAFQSTSGSTYTLTPAQVKAADPLGIGITPGMLQLLQKYPAGNAPALGADQGLNFSGYLFNAPVQLDYRTYVFKTDWAIDAASKHNVSFRGTLSNYGQTNLAAQLPGQSAASQLLSDNRGFGVRYTAVLTPNITNTAGVGLTRIGYGITGSASTGLTFGNISPLENFTRGSSRINPNWNITDDLNWSKGRHTFTAGVNILRFNNTINNYNNSFQSYSFGRGSLLGLGADINGNVLDVIGQPNLKLANGTALTTAMGDVLGILTGGSVTYNYQKDGSVLPLGAPTKFNFLARTYGLYVQDSWKVTPKLTLTYGLRYEYATPPYESTGLQVVPSTGLDKLFADRVGAAAQGIPGNQVPGGQLVSYDLNGPVNGKASWFQPDKNNFAPRLAVAYAPDSKTSIRVGASMVYDQFGNDLAAQVASSGSLGLATTKSFPVSYNFTTAPRYAGAGLPALPTAPAGGFPFTPSLNRAISGSSFGMSPDLVAPYALLANVSAARQIGHSLTLDVGYVGRFAHKLLLQQNIGTPLLNFKDNKSGMTFIQADGQLRGIFDSGVTPNQVKANPGLIPTNAFAENMFPGLQNYYFPGSASANYFYGIYGQYAGSDLDNLHALDRVTSTAFPNCIVVTGCFTFFLPQASSLPTWFNAGNSNYHALTATLRRSLQNGLSFDFNYTWSHSIDNSSVAASGAGSAGGVITNAYAPSISRNSSDYDLRHQINANFVYEVPLGKGRRFLGSAPWWLDEAVGGWQVSSIVHMQSGLPSTMGGSGAYSSNYNQSNQTVQKGASVPTGSVKYDQFGYPSLFSSTSQTSSYTDYYPGGTGMRGIVRMPWQRNVDASVVKNFPIRWEHQSLQFRAEAFNILNAVNFTNVSLSISSPGTFGEFTAASDARVLQLALRYSF